MKWEKEYVAWDYTGAEWRAVMNSSGRWVMLRNGEKHHEGDFQTAADARQFAKDEVGLLKSGDVCGG